MIGLWGELEPGDVVLQGPLHDWQHAWLVLWIEPSRFAGKVEFAYVDLDTGVYEVSTRSADKRMLFEYDVLRRGGYPIEGEP